MLLCWLQQPAIERLKLNPTEHFHQSNDHCFIFLAFVSIPSCSQVASSLSIMLNLLLTLCQYDCVIDVSDVCNNLYCPLIYLFQFTRQCFSYQVFCVNVEQTRRKLKRAHIQACVYICERVCVRGCARVRVRMCVLGRLHVRARVGVRVCALAGALTSMRA